MAGSSLFPAVLAGILEDAFSRLLALDPDSPDLLRPLAGKVLALRVSPFAKTLFLCPTATGVQIHERFEREPDAVLTGTPWAFARLGLSASPEGSLFGGEVRMEGDADTARRFRDLMEALHVDWEDQLAGVLGAGVAERVFGTLRVGRRWGGETLETFGLNVAEYLQEESRDLPAVAEVDEFLRNVDTLRAGCDRLEARVDRLAATLGPVPDSGLDSQG